MTAPPDSGERIEEWSDEALFEAYAEEPSRRLRNELVNRHLGLAYHIAGQYAGRGVARDDLNQVAMLALVKAVGRFDPTRGVPLSSYAGRTIEGELKRHFRDRTWQVRTPRSLKQMSVTVRKASAELEQRLGRSPFPREVAAHLDVAVDDVVEALVAAGAYRPDSLDAPPPGEDSGGLDRDPGLGTDEGGFGDVEARLVTDRLLEVLEDKDREIVRLRFFEHLSQQAIADRVGVSQMTVSRVLRRSFAKMREAATQPAPPPEADGGATVPTTSLRMRPALAEIGPTRDALASWLTQHDVPAEDADVLRLVVSELLTNAVQRKPGEDVALEVAVDRDRTAVQLHVRNQREGGESLPSREEWGPEHLLAPRGRGLMIVDRVCSQVAWRDTRTTTTVMARYRLRSSR